MKAPTLLATAAALLASWTTASQENAPNATPADTKLEGIPFYQIYEEKDIEDSSIGIFITSSPDGRLFFGDENGIHTFDGSRWKQILQTVSTRDKIRSIAWTDRGVFAAGYGTIGKLLFDGAKGISYEPINDEPFSNYANEFYSSIHQIGDLLYFVGERSIVAYDLSTETLHPHIFDSWLKGSLVHQGKLLVAAAGLGLVQVDRDSKATIPEYSQFTDAHVILHFTKNSKGQIIFATESNEIFEIGEGQELQSFSRFSYTPKGKINDIEFIGDSQLALTLSGSGILIIDTNGTLLRSLLKEIDYRWASANQLHIDRQGTVWTLFNSTVGKVLANDPLTQIDERLRPNVFYPVTHEVDGKLYMRVNGQILTPQHDSNGFLTGFENAIPTLPLSISVALKAPDGLYFHGGTETYLLRNGQIVFLGENGRIDRLATLATDPNHLIATSSSEIRILKREGATLRTTHTLSHNAGLVNKIAQDEQQNIWFEIGLGKIGRLTFLKGEPQFNLYTAEHGLPPDWITVWQHGKEVLFTENTGVYRFDSQSNSFQKTYRFESFFPSGKGSFQRAATDPQGNIWASYNNHNYILWRQPDGSYHKDSYSLAQLGELYLSEFKFLENGDAILSTSTEMFHLDSSRLTPPPSGTFSKLNLLEVSNIEGTRSFYHNSGADLTPPSIDIPKKQRSLTFRIGNLDSSKILPPSFQFSLSGMSDDWSKWGSTNEVHFTKLAPGEYTLRVRSRRNDDLATSEIAIPFKITPTFWESPIAYLVYIVSTLATLYLIYSRFTQKLKRTNEQLEQMVGERTKEIEDKNTELQKNADELSRALIELRSAQDMIIATSRKAGMAEVATNVLHNVGNVLNSINVGVLSLSERLEQERVTKLSRVSDLINDNQDQLGKFLTSDPRGKAIPAYLTQLSNVLLDDFSHYQVEVDCIQENIEHIKKIIATQQTHAKTVEVLQTVNVSELIESAISLIMGDLEHSAYEINTDFEPNLEIVSDKHSILQMVTNFIKNAKESIQEQSPSLGLICVSAKTAKDPEFICIRISDNGIGISNENMRKIFTHGFTTKKDGHGFGMHSCANAAKALGGNLQIESDGPGKGAVITLTLPIAPRNRKSQTNKPDSEEENLSVALK